MAKDKGRSAGEILRDEVPDSDVVPDGGYLATIANMEVGETGNNAKTPGAKMWKCQYSIKEPKEWKGIPLFDNFVIGNEDDPEATKSSTWKASRGAKALKRLLTAAQVPLEGDEDLICETAKGQPVFLVVVCQTQEEGEYKGVTQNRVRGYYAEGEREPEVTGEVPTSAKKPSVKEALKKKRVVEEDEDEDEEEEDEAPKKKKVVDEDEDDDDEEEPPAKRGRPKGSKNKPKDEDEDEDDDEDEEEEERPKGKRRE